MLQKSNVISVFIKIYYGKGEDLNNEKKLQKNNNTSPAYTQHIRIS